MAKRSYGQYCALARAFDVIGERWTPLLLRELAMGPRRYADLQDGLPGVGTSLLAERLKELEAEGVVRKRFLSPPAARWVYDLTDEGRELAEAMIPLARWGSLDLDCTISAGPAYLHTGVGDAVGFDGGVGLRLSQFFTRAFSFIAELEANYFRSSNVTAYGPVVNLGFNLSW